MKGILDGLGKAREIHILNDTILVFPKKTNWTMLSVKQFFEKNVNNFEIDYSDIHEGTLYKLTKENAERYNFKETYLCCKGLNVVNRVPMRLVNKKAKQYCVSKDSLGEDVFNAILSLIKLDNLQTYKRKMTKYTEEVRNYGL